jgi:hypothetical protein
MSVQPVDGAPTGYSWPRGRARSWVLLVLFGWCAITAYPAGQDAVEWSIGGGNLGSSDRRAILKLAKQIGIPDPRKVSGAGGDCPRLLVESHPIVDGRSVRMATAWVFRAKGTECPGAFDKRLPHAGKWYSSAPSSEPAEYWRIQDGTWFADVRRNDMLGYATVERIVLTVRAKAFVERCAEGSLHQTAADISHIATNDERQLRDGVDNGDHSIYTTARRPNSMIGYLGLEVMVKVTPGDVEFVRCSFWVA